MEVRIIKVPIDPILIASPHHIFYVPASFGEGGPPLFVSEDSKYYCSSPRRFIVDVKMATYSNTDPIEGTPTWPTGKMRLWAIPWDVPGSWNAGGEPPVPRFALQDDINRYELWVSFYRKLGDGPMENKAAHHLTGGSWFGGKPPSGVPKTQEFHIQASQAGWDTYRVAVACLMRGVPQQVAVGFTFYPPE